MIQELHTHQRGKLRTLHNNDLFLQSTYADSWSIITEGIALRAPPCCHILSIWVFMPFAVEGNVVSNSNNVKMIIFFMMISFVVNFGAKLRQFQTLSKKVGSNSLYLQNFCYLLIIRVLYPRKKICGSKFEVLLLILVVFHEFS